MRFVFYTNNVSPHQLPLAARLMARVGHENFLYVMEEREWYGKTVETDLPIVQATDERAREWLENAEVMYMGGLRPVDLMERRVKRGLTTLYYSERWFKPFPLFDLKLLDCLIGVTVPGWVRMFVPWYRKMARRFVKLANENECVTFLPVGPWARRDFIRLGVRPDKLVDWGYFVEKGTGKQGTGKQGIGSDLKILWVGRMLGWKRVDTIIRAANEFKVQGLKFKVTLVGDGPEKSNLIRLAQRLFPGGVAIEHSNIPNNRTIVFLPRQPLEKVRELMRQYDLYVLASDACEGWGAVVNEALEEGMPVIGTFEAGASAAILPWERLFPAGDWKALCNLVMKDAHGALPECSIGPWTADAAAEKVLGLGGWHG